MVGTLLLLCQFSVDRVAGQPRVEFAPSMAKVVGPAMHVAQGPEFVAGEDDGDWPVADSTALPDDGIPPSPAILNRQGWNAAVSIMASWFAGPAGDHAVDPVEITPDPTGLSPVTPELEEILVEWESATRRIVQTEIRFTRTIYDLAPEVEIRTDGVLFYESPDRGEIRIYPSAIAGKKSQRIGRDGAPFRIEADSGVSLKATPDEFVFVDHREMTYCVVPLPEGYGARSTGLFLATMQQHAPLVFEVRAENVRRDWSVALLERGKTSVILELVPRTSELRRRYGKCLVKLDTEPSRISAVKYFAANGDRETVYTVRSFQPMRDKCHVRENEICFPMYSTKSLQSRGFRPVTAKLW